MWIPCGCPSADGADCYDTLSTSCGDVYPHGHMPDNEARVENSAQDRVCLRAERAVGDAQRTEERVNLPAVVQNSASERLQPRIGIPANFLTLARLRHPVKRCLLYTSDAADERSSVDLGG